MKTKDTRDVEVPNPSVRMNVLESVYAREVTNE